MRPQASTPNFNLVMNIAFIAPFTNKVTDAEVNPFVTHLPEAHRTAVSAVARINAAGTEAWAVSAE